MKKLIVLLIFAGLTSCSTNPFEAEIATTDSLTAVMDTVRLKLASIDMDQTKKIGQESQLLEKYLSENYSDSLDREFWVNKMTPLYDVQRGLSKFLAGEKEIREELIYTIEQLKTFRNSLKDEKISKEEAYKYLEQEKNAVSQISYFVGKYQPKVERGLREWERINQGMYRISDSLKAL